MSDYGIELYADTGFKFVIPDYSGFVFSHYRDFTLGNKTWDDSVFYSQPYTSGAQALAMVRIIGRSGSTSLSPTIAYQDTGSSLNFTYIYYHPSFGPSDKVTVRIYFFFNKEATTDPSSYGLQVYDSGGKIVFHTSSRPLRLQRISWGYQENWSKDMGYGVATLCARLGQKGIIQQQPFSQTHIHNIIPVGEGTVLKAALSYQQTVPVLVNANRNIDPDIVYINTSHYD